MTHSYEHGNIYNTVVHKRTQVCTCLMTDRKETCMHVQYLQSLDCMDAYGMKSSTLYQY